MIQFLKMLSRRISSLSPLDENITTTSPWRIDPRSPWTASAGERKWLGVPVLANVAEIFRATCPALPIPLVSTLARQSSISRRRLFKSATAADIAADCRRLGVDHLPGDFDAIILTSFTTNDE